MEENNYPNSILLKKISLIVIGFCLLVLILLAVLIMAKKKDNAENQKVPVEQLEKSKSVKEKNPESTPKPLTKDEIKNLLNEEVTPAPNSNEEPTKPLSKEEINNLLEQKNEPASTEGEDSPAKPLTKEEIDALLNQ